MILSHFIIIDITLQIHSKIRYLTAALFLSTWLFLSSSWSHLAATHYHLLLFSTFISLFDLDKISFTWWNFLSFLQARAFLWSSHFSSIACHLYLDTYEKFLLSHPHTAWDIVIVLSSLTFLDNCFSTPSFKTKNVEFAQLMRTYLSEMKCNNLTKIKSEIDMDSDSDSTFESLTLSMTDLVEKQKANSKQKLDKV